MKSTGMRRQVDQLGRVVLPKEIRKSLGIDEKDLLEIYVEGDNIILKKNEHDCVFCGGSGDIIEHQGKYICKSCLQAIISNNR